MDTPYSLPWRSLARPFKWLHQRLMPRVYWAGWMPYLWLVYLSFFFIQLPGVPPWNLMTWVIALSGAAVFLALYFRSFNCSPHELPVILAGISTLGYIFVLYTGTGHTFIIYACALAAHYGNMRKSMIAVGLVLGGFLLEVLALHLMPGADFAHSMWFWLPTVVLGGVIGTANAWFADDATKRSIIDQSQEEIRRLAATAERERIARDLHDILGHTLTLITVKAELAARLAERDLAAAAPEIRELERISRDALRQVREAVGGYRSGGVAGELVNARVALSAAHVELSSDIAQLDCPASHDYLFALVLREAVTNIVRHSGASHCRVQLKHEGPDLLLSVQDDGHGGDFREGNGIRGMRERLAMLDGMLEVDSGREGTRLTAILPLPPAVAAESAAAASLPTPRAAASR